MLLAKIKRSLGLNGNMSTLAHAQTSQGVLHMHLIKYQSGVDIYILYYMKTTSLPDIFQKGL